MAGEPGVRGRVAVVLAGAALAGPAWASGADEGSVLGAVLRAMAVILVATQVMGWLVRRLLGQPPVMGEILAGILLGPSLLGALWPAAGRALIPPEAVPHLGVVAKIGVVLFMFLVGLELDQATLRRGLRATAVIASASIAVPFALGGVLAMALHGRYAPDGVGLGVFALFLGVATSVTAFPVLARILTDRQVHRTVLGGLALSTAAVGDVVAWVLLALVVGIASAEGAGLAWTLAWVVAYVAFMLGVVRPLVARLASAQNRLDGPVGRPVVAAVAVALLASAQATEAIGIHALFGAFLLGAILPHDGRLAAGLRQRFEDLVVVLFLPAFFALTGLGTSIGLLDAGDWLACAAIVAVATVGKLVGTYAGARATGLPPRDAGALGILMNTRGLMELIVLDVGREMGILSPELYAMFVIMALVTTFATTPVLDRLLARGAFSGTPEAA